MLEKEPIRRFESEEEIDLKLVLINIFRFIKTNLKILFTFFTLGVFGGWVAYQILPPVYRAQLLAYSNIINSSEVVAIVESWQELIIKNDDASLAKRMQVNPEIIKNLKSIEARTVPSSVGPNDPDNKDAFIISIQTYNNDNLDSLQTGIIRCIENNPNVKKLTNAEKMRLTLLRSKITQEITQLDSVKNSIRSLLQKSNSNNAVPFISEPGSINIGIVNLYTELQEINKDLQFVDAVQVIDEFGKFEIPDSPKLSLCLLIGAVIGIITAFVIIIIKNLRHSA
jgi:hypothetical protein